MIERNLALAESYEEADSMEEALALINKIIDEHKVIIGRVQSLEQAANDASVLVGLEKARDTFVPGRLDQKQGLQKLQGDAGDD